MTLSEVAYLIDGRLSFVLSDKYHAEILDSAGVTAKILSDNSKLKMVEALASDETSFEKAAEKLAQLLKGASLIFSFSSQFSNYKFVQSIRIPSTLTAD